PDVVRPRVTQIPVSAHVPGCQIEAPEAQGGVADVERGQAPTGVGLGGFPLEAGLERAPLPDRESLRDALGSPPHGVEPCVGGIEVALFRLEFRLSQRARSGFRELASLW